MIIAFSGKKQSGKNTGVNFCLGYFLKKNGLIKNFDVNAQGLLVVDNVVIDPLKPDGRKFLESFKDHCLLINFGDSLKTDVCINLLGLDYNGCYGTNEEKEQYSHLYWEDMPGITINPENNNVNLEYHEPGLMKNREVMQYVGTKIFRKMYMNCWINAMVNKLKASSAKLKLISDVRFQNEVEVIQRLGGMVVRLTKNVKNDKDESETALDNYNGFDVILDNVSMNVPQQNNALFHILKKSGL